MSVIYIYALTDPRDNTVRYIGKTKNNLNKRLREHIHESSNTYKSNWIRSLINKGLKPSIQIIDNSTELDWKTKEQYWIGMFPNLVNASSGGDNGMTKEFSKKGENHPMRKLTTDQVKK